MNYHYDKLKSELSELKGYYTSLYNSWSKPSDYEELYKIRIPLLVIATLLRVIGNKSTRVQALRDIQTHENPRDLMFTSSQVSELIYSDDFKNRVKAHLLLEEVCNYLIHEKGSVYLDDRTNWQQVDNFNIYYCVYTDQKEEVAINIGNFIESVEKVIAQAKA